MKDVFDLSDLEMLARDCLTRAGVSDATACIVAREVALSEVTGDVESGFAALLRDIRLIRYGRLLPDGDVVVSTPAPSIIRVSGGHGFGVVALMRSMPDLMTATHAQGMAMVHLTEASDPGAMASVMHDLAASGLAALSVRTHGQAFAIRPGAAVVNALDNGPHGMLSALLSLAPPPADTPIGGPVSESAWLMALDPAVTAAEELIGHLPVVNVAPRGGEIALAPELLAQIVNA